MCDFENIEIISKYTRQQAIEDGILVEVFDEYIMKGLNEFTNGRQIVATTHLAQEMESMICGIFGIDLQCGNKMLNQHCQKKNDYSIRL